MVPVSLNTLPNQYALAVAVFKRGHEVETE